MDDPTQTPVCTVNKPREGEPPGTPDEVSQAMRDRLVRLAYRFLWSREDAEDAAHEALEAAHTNAADLRDRSKWWSWVCRIVVQRCRLRGRQRQRWREHREHYRIEVDRRSRREPAPEWSERAHALKRLLPRLPQRQYEVIVLRHLQSMSYEEIGEVLGIAPATARAHAKAAREGLAALAARSGDVRLGQKRGGDS